MRGTRPEWQQKIAKERIDILFNLAKKEFGSNASRSTRYVELARKIGMRYKVTLPDTMKNKFCKKCNHLLIPGKNMRKRLDSRKKKIFIKCLDCNTTSSRLYK